MNNSKIIPYKNRLVNYDKQVLIYRNLNSKNIHESYSIQQFGLVIGHTNKIYLKDVEFVIRKSGKQKAIHTKQRNVHAFIKGIISNINLETNTNLHRVKYNPFLNKNFYLEKNNEEISYSKAVIINNLGVFIVK